MRERESGDEGGKEEAEAAGKIYVPSERTRGTKPARREVDVRVRPSVCPPVVRLLVVYLVGLLRAASARRPLKSTRSVALCSSQVDCRGKAPGGRPNEARVGRRESGIERERVEGGVAAKTKTAAVMMRVI